MNFQKILFICGLEQSRRDLLQMILPIGEKIIFYLIDLQYKCNTKKE